MREHYLKFQGFYLTFLAIIFVSLGAYYFIHFGYYPIAMVNSQLISAHSFSREYSAAYQYYFRALIGQKGAEPESPEFKKELRRAALNDLIEKALIAQELKKRVGGELSRLVENKINAQQINQENFDKAAKLLYGLDLVDFKALVLVPKAEREVLEERLFLEKKDIGEWLTEAKQAANVFILTPEFFWDKNRVAIR